MLSGHSVPLGGLLPTSSGKIVHRGIKMVIAVRQQGFLTWYDGMGTAAVLDSLQDFEDENTEPDAHVCSQNMEKTKTYQGLVVVYGQLESKQSTISSASLIGSIK